MLTIVSKLFERDISEQVSEYVIFVTSALWPSNEHNTQHAFIRAGDIWKVCLRV